PCWRPIAAMSRQPPYRARALPCPCNLHTSAGADFCVAAIAPLREHDRPFACPRTGEDRHLEPAIISGPLDVPVSGRLTILENIGRLSAAFAHLDERTPVLRGGSGLGAGTTFGFSLCDNEALGRSDKLGETATLDGRETMGAPAVCADSAAVAAT